MSIDLSEFRFRGVVLLAMLSWGWTVAFALLGVLFTMHNGLLVLILSAAINVLPSLCALRRRYDFGVAAAFGIAAAVQPAFLVYMLNGHVWQMEGHMFFFAGLAGLTLLCDWKPIAVAVVIIAAHHLLLTYIAPEWVFTGSGNLPRVMLHALAVSIVLGLTAPVMIGMAKLIVNQSEARMLSEQSAAAALEALAATRAAEQNAQAERQKRQAEQRASSDARRSELLDFAGAFEASVATISRSVSLAAEQLAEAAGQLHRFARDAGNQAAAASIEADAASRNAVEVSSAVSQLSTSIASIAAVAEQQAGSGQIARNSSLAGETVMRTLAERTSNIDAFVTLIETVAARTNLLALNAAIEAARAGETGLGFAVVAAEVKDLAKKTKGATGQIKELVAGVDLGATEATQVMTRVAKAMSDVADASAVIRKEIGDQKSVATSLNRNAAETAAGADLIAGRIGDVALAAGEAVQLSDEVHESAANLNMVAQSLQSATGEFLSRLRTA